MYKMTQIISYLLYCMTNYFFFGNKQQVLKLDPQNYTAWVCIGAALHEVDKGQQCVEAYKRAIEINPNQAPAWQGLVQHYEKSGVKNHPDLLEGYSKIATFFEK